MNVLGSEQRACQIHHARSWSSGFYARKIVEDKKAKIELAFIMPPGPAALCKLLGLTNVSWQITEKSEIKEEYASLSREEHFWQKKK